MAIPYHTPPLDVKSAGGGADDEACPTVMEKPRRFCYSALSNTKAKGRGHAGRRAAGKAGGGAGR